jgi:CHAD domain-containing protein
MATARHDHCDGAGSTPPRLQRLTDLPAALIVPGPDRPAGVAVQAALGQGLKRLLEAQRSSEPGSAREAESTHQMRVACRRLRSDLRTFATLIDPVWGDNLRGVLRELAEVLGALREADVLIDRLERDAGADRPALARLFEGLERRRAEARRSLEAELAAPEYTRLVVRLAEAARAPHLVETATTAARDVLPPLVRRAWRKLARAARKLGRNSSPDDYHAARIRAKRARYAAEAVALALDPGPARQAGRLARGLARLQDLLGEYQDATTAAREVEAVAGQLMADGATDADFEAAVGALLERQHRAARAARRRFPAAWKALDRRSLRSWMRGPG